MLASMLRLLANVNRANSPIPYSAQAGRRKAWIKSRGLSKACGADP